MVLQVSLEIRVVKKEGASLIEKKDDKSDEDTKPSSRCHEKKSTPPKVKFDFRSSKLSKSMNNNLCSGMSVH